MLVVNSISFSLSIFLSILYRCHKNHAISS